MPIWQDALTLEHFILEEDMDNLQNYLSIQNIDINSTYDFIGLSSHRTNFSFFEKLIHSPSTPIEYARIRNEFNLDQLMSFQNQKYINDVLCYRVDDKILVGDQQKCLAEP